MAFKEKVKELSRELKVELKSLYKPRADLLTMAVISMCAVRSINLVKVAHGMVSKAKVLSNYRRLQRFMSQVDWSKTEIGVLLLKLSSLEGPYIVLVDRTNWKFGRANINFLVFTILGDGYSIPIKWMLLPKRGNSAQFERISLLKEVVNLVGQNQIRYVIGDREFIGEHWVKYLIDNNIGFILRAKANMIAERNGTKTKLGTLCKKNRKSSHQLPGKYSVGNNEVFVSGFRFKNDKGKLEYLILLSSNFEKDTCNLYAKRWYIESMFKDLKSNGFQLENTHITDPRRLESLFGVLAIAYVWMIRIGSLIKRQKPKLFKKKMNGKPRKSIFRAGLDNYTGAIIRADYRKIWIYFRFLSCT